MRRTIIGLVVVLGIAWGGLGALVGSGNTPRLGLDLQGGTSVVLTAPVDTEQDILELAVERMRSRIEEIGGVQEPEIAISGASTVVVQLPGVEDEQRALDVLGQQGELSFRPVLGLTPGSIGPLADVPETTTTTTIPDEAGTTTTVAGEDTTTTTTTVPVDQGPVTIPDPCGRGGTYTFATAEELGLDPATGITVTDRTDREAYIQSDGSVLHLGPACLIGTDVAQATPGFITTSGVWGISLDLTSDGGDAFAAMTGQAANYTRFDPRRQIAIVLDGEVLAAPRVFDDVQPGVGIAGGRAQITLGDQPDDEAQARDLAVVLRYGSLPVSFERSQVQKVSASLGADSLRTGLVAGMAGLILVTVVLLVYYRVLGLVALIGLTVFGSSLIALFTVLGEGIGLTLTLAGVTGIIVSVGITADSYIVYFERIKDEIRNGANVTTAVTDGFKAAFRTILTADTVSLLGAGLLYILAVGPVKGFALSLGMATILDIIIARVYTRRAAWLVAHTGLATGGILSIGAAAGRSEAHA